MLTVYGIETDRSVLLPFDLDELQQCLPFTVLKPINLYDFISVRGLVATVLTVYGIETVVMRQLSFNIFTALQQCLPFTVLKHNNFSLSFYFIPSRCNSAYRLRY